MWIRNCDEVKESRKRFLLGKSGFHSITINGVDFDGITS